MYKYKGAKDGNKAVRFIDSFGGLNHNLRISDNEFSNVANMTSKYFPVLASRPTFRGSVRIENKIIVGCTYNQGSLWTVYEENGNLFIKSGNITYLLGAASVITGRTTRDRQVVNFGAYIVIFPDKLYINTLDTDERGSLEKTFRNIDDSAHYNKWYVTKPCDIEGKEYIADYYGSIKPENPKDNFVWYDTHERVIRVWSNAYSMWIVPTIYHKYRIQGIGIFKEGDSVKIRQYDGNEEQETIATVIKVYRNESGDIHAEYPPMNADYIIVPAGDMKVHWKNYENRTQGEVWLYHQWRNLLSIEQLTPDMDYVCECQGRLWGCRYGETVKTKIKQYRERFSDTDRSTASEVTIAVTDEDEEIDEVLTYWLFDDNYVKLNPGEDYDSINYQVDEESKTITVTVTWGQYTGSAHINVNYTTKKTEKVNEIYASKQQDFKCWNYYQATAMDSYTLSLGASGNFTGCINYNGYPLFSKEDRFCLIYGNFPAEYRLSENVFEGVQSGAYRTMAISNGTLFYKGRHGIYAYRGGYPTKISNKLTDRIFEVYDYLENQSDVLWFLTNGACYNGIYYLSTKDENGVRERFILTYDIERGIWNKLLTNYGTGENEINSPVAFMIDCINSLKAICYCKTNNGFESQIKNIETDNDSTEAVEWWFDTGLIGLDLPEEKYIARITVRCKGDADVYIRYDSKAPTVKIEDLNRDEVGSHTFTIIPQRCDHFDLAFRGTGEFILYSIAMTIETGSDIDNE